MYFSIEARGKGLGSLMIDLCLKSAIEHGFEKCYIETMTTIRVQEIGGQIYGQTFTGAGNDLHEVMQAT